MFLEIISRNIGLPLVSFAILEQIDQRPLNDPLKMKNWL